MIGSDVIGPVTCQLMSGGDNPTHQFRVSARYPTEHEERGLHIGFSQNLEQSLGIALDASWQPLPISAVDGRCESLDLEIILDIDRHRMRRARLAGAVVPCLWRRHDSDIAPGLRFWGIHAVIPANSAPRSQSPA